MRKANIDDLPRIVEIYNSTISSRIATAETKEVTVENRAEWFGRHSEKLPIYVEEINGQIAGWVSFESFYGRSAYHLTAEISIYVHEHYRSNSLGSKLLEEAIGLCPFPGFEEPCGIYFFSQQCKPCSF